MSYKHVLSSLGFSEPSVLKAVGEKGLGYKQALAGLTDAQIEDHLYMYTNSMGKLYCLHPEKNPRHIDLIGTVNKKEMEIKTPLTKVSLSQVAGRFLGDWNSEVGMKASLQKGANIDVLPEYHRWAKGFIPASFSPKGTRKDGYEYLDKYGLVSLAGSNVTSAQGLVLFYDPPTYDTSSGKKKVTKREAFEVIKTLSFNGVPYLAEDPQTKKMIPAVVRTNVDSVSRMYLALCSEMGAIAGNLPTFLVTIGRESSLTLNIHRLELGQALRSEGTYAGADATRATSYGLTQVMGNTNFGASELAKPMWGLLGLDKFPTLDSPTWSTLDGTLAMAVINFVLFSEVAATSARSFFARYAGMDAGFEDQMVKMVVPKAYNFSPYNEVLTRAIAERALIKHFSK